MNDETGTQRRERFRSWMTDEPDPYYRHQFWLLSLTPGQRLRRWWSINGWLVITALVSLALAVLVLVMLP